MTTDPTSPASTTVSSRPTSALAATGAVSLAVTAGLLLGVLDLALQVYLPYPLATLADSSAVWAVAAFLLGRSLRVAPGVAACAGAVLLVVAVEVYYLAAWAVGMGAGGSALSFVATSWMTAGIIAGAVFGAAGTWSHQRETWLGAASLALAAGVLVGEAGKRLSVLPSMAPLDRGDALDALGLTALLGVALLGLAHDHPTQLRRAALLVLPMAVVCLVGFRLVGFVG